VRRTGNGSPNRRPRPQAEGAVVPQGRRHPRRKGRGGGRSHAGISASGCERRDFTKPSVATAKALRSPKRAPNRQSRGNRPEARAGREMGKGFGPSRDPKRGFSMRLRPRTRAPGDRRGLRAEPRSEREFERLRPRGIPRKARASARPFRKRGDRRGFGLDASLWRRRGFGRPDPRGSMRGASLSSGPTGCRTRPCGFAPGSEESEAGVRARLAIRKPPSERWPRHPATAVKAGTSGGRWRHRPPL
jgi:hypothetical protein